MVDVCRQAVSDLEVEGVVDEDIDVDWGVADREIASYGGDGDDNTAEDTAVACFFILVGGGSGLDILCFRHVELPCSSRCWVSDEVVSFSLAAPRL